MMVHVMAEQNTRLNPVGCFVVIIKCYLSSGGITVCLPLIENKIKKI